MEWLLVILGSLVVLSLVTHVMLAATPTLRRDGVSPYQPGRSVHGVETEVAPICSPGEPAYDGANASCTSPIHSCGIPMIPDSYMGMPGHAHGEIFGSTHSAGMPTVNVNGMPMIPGTYIDVTGHVYGDGSSC